jgi:predicted O-methyltransferase YrrM
MSKVQEENRRFMARAVFRGMSGGAHLWGSEMASHMPALAFLASKWSVGHIVELGVGRGYSTISLLSGLMGSGKWLVSYDIEPAREENVFRALAIERPPFELPWQFRVRDSVEAAKDWQDGSVSLLFLDTSHDYDHTKRELEAWLPKMHPEGVIAGHDYFLDRMGPIVCGVGRAVDEFARDHASRMTLQVLPHDQGLFILWPEPSRRPLLASYDDEDVTFVVEVYKNLPLASWCLDNLRAHYPKSRLLVWSDGDDDGAIGPMVADRGGIFRQGDRLWNEGKSGALWTRRLREYMDAPTPYLVKIDTDTGFYRRIKKLPKEDCIFGTYAWSPECPRLIQGGFIGMTRRIAEKILWSGMLGSEKLKRFSYIHDSGQIMAAEDKALGSIATDLGIPLYDHTEISSNWKGRVPNPELKYAVVHPCKDAKL